MGKFKNLMVWQEAKDLAVFIYKTTNRDEFNRDFGLKDQIRRAAVSIPSNIAEGDELKTNKQSINYFYYAKGSTAEVMTQLIISHEIGYLPLDDFRPLKDRCEKISDMLFKLIQARENNHIPTVYRP